MLLCISGRLSSVRANLFIVFAKQSLRKKILLFKYHNYQSCKNICHLLLTKDLNRSLVNKLCLDRKSVV